MDAKIPLLFYRCAALVIIISSLIGGINYYTPVPFWDMWDGYLGFYNNVLNGHQEAWWAQHNEHRIVLSRILFWVDLKWFEGLSQFLIVSNYLLITSSCIAFYVALKDVVGIGNNLALKILGLVCVALLFSWMQEDNMTWGFQSQFILAQLLPLLSFILLQKAAVTEKSSTIFFVAACALGLLSTASMANGILALPLMALMALCQRQNFIRVATLAILSIVSISLYFTDYRSPATHGSLKDALLSNPIGMVKYILLYLGSPVYYMTGKGAAHVAQLFGFFSIISTLYFFLQAVKKPSIHACSFAMIFFLIYIGGSAFGTAGGRLVFGIGQALSSRYTTPVLMAWCALIVLYSPYLSKKIAENKMGIHVGILLVFILLIPIQYRVFDSQKNKNFERNIAALALELGIKDQQQIVNVFPSADWALKIVKEPVDRNLSIFGVAPLVDLNTKMGSPLIVKEQVACLGSLDETQTFEDGGFVRVRGWIFNVINKQTPQLIHILDQNKNIIGFALSGQHRPDVQKAIDVKAEYSGFKGYILSTKVNSAISLFSDSCALAIPASSIPYNLKAENISLSHLTVSATQIEGKNDWVGTDYYKTMIDGVKIYGSFIHSDADIGKITLNLNRGDKFYYRSGPTGGRQTLKINDKSFPTVVLPVAIEWTILEFNNPNLLGTFSVDLSDSGDQWGEWSAIAVLSHDVNKP
ncbi:MAG: hypothetical protein V4732_08905 [Pseudomonadota bacterium]